MIKREELFPTLIYFEDNSLNNNDFKNIKDDILTEYKKEPRENWQSLPNLHNNSLYLPLVNKVKQMSVHVFNDQNLVVNDFVITSMWSNILKKGEYHKPHTHSNNYLSGVFYTLSDTDDNNRSDIMFQDPRLQADIFTPDTSMNTRENSRVWYVPALENRIIIFPSWLQHHVPVNKSDKVRSSIAFNVMLKGVVNADISLQSAEF
tara:strand:+ start:86 stop:700 length:615 start_codon:yes stop_codon:yes gene_type:complete